MDSMDEETFVTNEVRNAVDVLAYISPEDAIRFLNRAREQNKGNAHKFMATAAAALAERDPEKALGWIEEIIQDFSVHFLVQNALEKTGEAIPEKTVQFYRDCCADEDWRVRKGAMHAINALTEIDPRTSLELIKKTINENDEFVIFAAVYGLEKVAEQEETAEEAYRVLDTLLEGKDESRRKDAAAQINGLVKSRPDLAVKIYDKVLDDRRVNVREKAARMLHFLVGNAPYEQVRRLYGRALDDPNHSVRKEAQTGMDKLMEANIEDAIDFVERGINDGPKTREEAATHIGELLGKSQDERIYTMLQKALRSREKFTRGNAAYSLRHAQFSERIYPFLVKIGKDRETSYAVEPAVENLFAQRPDKAEEIYERLRYLADVNQYGLRLALGLEKREGPPPGTENAEHFVETMAERLADEAFTARLKEKLQQALTEIPASEHSLQAVMVDPKPLERAFHLMIEDESMELFDEERRFIEMYLDSPCSQTQDGSRKNTDELIDELRPLADQDRDYKALMRVLKHGEARGIRQVLELDDLKVEGFLPVGKISEQGLSSVVYLAVDQRLDEESEEYLALKIISKKAHPKIAEHEAKGGTGFEEMFVLDINNLKDLSHPNLAKIQGVGRTGDRMYLAQTYYEKGSLEERLQQVEPVKTINDILEGLSFLHSEGYVHRDLKPANIFLKQDGTAVIGDFGNTRKLDEIQSQGLIKAEERYHGIGLTHGSSHAAPETLISHVADFRSDVYSMGLVIARMLTGARYAVGKTREELKAMNEQEREEHYARVNGELIAKIPENTTEGMKEMIKRCLAYNPEERYADGNELRQAFTYIHKDNQEKARQIIEELRKNPLLRAEFERLYNDD
ncbi:TPA: protein kinase [Candidatus Woesearchaeota archaeon]|nr:protein kinase [Candidatus Woesearchaeota archaeon]